MFDAYYDLSCSPPTYDIISFLCEVERERLSRDEEDVAITFLPGPAGGFRQDSFWPYSIEGRVMMRDRVARPLCRLLPSVRGVKLATTRLDAPVGGFGVGKSRYGFPRQVAAMRDGIRPMRPPQPAVARNERLVTMTMRECNHWPERNSKLGDWVLAASKLRAAGWEVVLVRDTLHARERLSDHFTDANAAENISARARLYATAAVNMFISNGPAWLSTAMDVPTLILRPVDDILRGPFGSMAFAQSGVPFGEQMPGSPPYQRLVWADDTVRNILDAFNEFVVDQKLIETGVNAA